MRKGEKGKRMRRREKRMRKAEERDEEKVRGDGEGRGVWFKG